MNNQLHALEAVTALACPMRLRGFRLLVGIMLWRSCGKGSHDVGEAESVEMITGSKNRDGPLPRC